MTVFCGPLAFTSREIVPPSILVPNPNIGKGPEVVGLSDHDVTWDATATLPASSYNVRVAWRVNGVIDAFDVVSQGNGIVTRSYDVDDDISADIWYVDDAGSGPSATVGPI